MSWSLRGRRAADTGATGGGRRWETYLDNLAPVVEAELGRGNEVTNHGEWQEVHNAYGRGELEHRLVLRYPLDVAAVEAEFELAPNMHLQGTSLVRTGPSNAVITSDARPDRPADEQRQAAVAAWWQRWENGPRHRRLLAPSSSGTATVRGPVHLDATPGDGER
jgi:hypothetical protein